MRVLNPSWCSKRSWRVLHRFGVMAIATTLISPWLVLLNAEPGRSQTSSSYCQLSVDAAAQKKSLLDSALEGNTEAENTYKSLVYQHAAQMQNCRAQTWPRQQGIWLRLYACDARPGALDELMDEMVNRGYNEVYIEVFFDGQVLLPVNDNRTPWPSMLRMSGYEHRDLLAEAIAKGRERGLKVYAWMFTMNFGYSYAQTPQGQQALAMNGYGQTSQEFLGGGAVDELGITHDQTFADPYHLQAKSDYYYMVEAIARRRPDGVLFDYIRYPLGSGPASVAGQVRDLWVYGPAARQALYDRALNVSGEEVIRRFVDQGYITAQDIQDVMTLYPDDGEPLWQGRIPVLPLNAATPEEVQPYLQTELWQLGVAHAIQGILDFLNLSIQPVLQQNLKPGAVFFPEGNLPVGTGGYDSRLQPWDRFPSNIEWHPMSYATCGNATCIVNQVQRVLSMAPPGTEVKPVLAGTWGETLSGHPSLEAQMYAIQRAHPEINAISHFAFSWQNPASDRDRKFCQLR
jgi:hypothetical protein